MNISDHGGDTAKTARKLHRPAGDLLDFAASVNPLGMPAEVVAAAQAGVIASAHYPEADAAGLIGALSAHFGLPAGHFLPGRGATDLLFLFPRVLRPRRALLVTPCFSEYERSLLQTGTTIDFSPLSSTERFRLDPARLLHRLEPETDLIVLANPGNPTGVAVPREALIDIVQGAREQALVLVDESNIDFCPSRSVLSLLPEHHNLYVLRSFSSFYAMPGLRAGFLAGPLRGIARFGEVRQPWALCAPALAAAEACLAQEDYRRQSLELIPAWREELAAALAGLGRDVFPSETNILLVQLPPSWPGAGALTFALAEGGILVRDAGNFPSLDDRHFRVTVRTPGENRRLLAALAALRDTIP